ncbi:hypothetical protein [Crocinitomix algicola]|uniref:hypothetical protein n=1 Tax=Crocinitomix algicola TaxID=1740263 RepID=UPI00087332BF|nr:hypothetical protein [Crocinitomix algicola]
MQSITLATTIRKEKDAQNIANLIKNYFSFQTVNLEKSGHRHLLHIKGRKILPQKIEQTLRLFGYRCSELI